MGFRPLPRRPAGWCGGGGSISARQTSSQGEFDNILLPPSPIIDFWQRTWQRSAAGPEPADFDSLFEAWSSLQAGVHPSLSASRIHDLAVACAASQGECHAWEA